MNGRVLVALFVLALASSLTAMSTESSPNGYRPGQVWSFRLDAKEPAATLTVLRVESLPQIGEVVHISVSAVRVPTGTIRVGHLPMARDAMDRSVLKVVGTSQGEPDLGGYEAWKQAKGGVFTVSVSEALEFVRETMRRAGK